MKLLLLASGAGTLAQSVIDAGIEIVSVVSDTPDAQVIERAKAAGISTKVIAFKEPRADWDLALLKYVESVKPDLVVSVGFMRILNSEFVTKFKVINSHPALLPNFPGAHAVRDALAAGISETGCTVHWVDEGVDTGKVIAQVAVEISPNDDEASLHERIKIVERKLIVKTIKELAESGALS
ncbi:MAG: phosphoribosylglycinamide formyltransferase [Candidatus Nanopelagicaceae bacterium]